MDGKASKNFIFGHIRERIKYLTFISYSIDKQGKLMHQNLNEESSKTYVIIFEYIFIS